MSAKNCCCRFGVAVAGENPEFECPACEVHRNGFGLSDERDRCRRHRQSSEATP